MASMTIRQLDEDLKQRLRLRAARHGRSMEDEARTILRAATAADENARAPAPDEPAPQRAPIRLGNSPGQHRAPQPGAGAGNRRVLLIIGGGIAAYKSLDLIRRLKERGMTVRCILTAAAQEFITPLSAGALSGERAFTDLFDARDRARRRPYPAGARCRSHRRGAGDRRPDGENGGRPCRRSRFGGPACNRAKRADRAGNESQHVGASGDAAQSRAPAGGRRSRDRPERRRDGGSG